MRRVYIVEFFHDKKMAKRKITSNRRSQKRPKRYTLFNPYETGSEVVYSNIGWDYTVGTILSFTFHPNTRVVRYRIRAPTCPGMNIVHDVTASCIESERSGYDFEVSAPFFQLTRDVEWYSTWRDNLKVGQKLLDICPNILLDRHVFVINVTSDSIDCQSEGERQVRSYPKNSKRVIPKIKFFDGVFQPIIKENFELPPQIFPEREQRDEFMGCKCIVDGREGHVIDVDYSINKYCVIYDQHLCCDRSMAWMPLYQTSSENYGIEWVSREFIHIEERDAVKARQINGLSSDDPVITFDMDLLSNHELRQIQEIYDMGDVEYAFDIMKYVTAFPFSFRSIPSYYPISYCHYLDNDKEVWNNMWSARFGAGTPWVNSVNLQAMQYSRSIPMFTFDLVDFKHVHERSVYTASLRVHYNGVFSTDIGHISCSQLTRVSNFLMRKIFNYSYPREAFLTYKEFVEYKSNKVNVEDIQLLQPRYISTLKGYQQHLVNKMYAVEQRRDQYTTDMFNRNFDGFKYNEIVGFDRRYHSNANGGILSLGIGLGKTVIIIELILRSSFEKTLIVVPTGILDQWRSELKRFAPSVSVSEYYMKKRDVSGTVVLTTYKMLSNSYLELITLPVFDRIVFDESHQLKGMNTQTLHGCSSIYARARWCLTATPCDDVLSLCPQLSMLQVYPFNYKTDPAVLQRIWNLDRGLFRKMLDEIVFEISETRLEQLGVNPMSHVIQAEQIVTLELPFVVKKLVAVLIENYKENFEYMTQRHLHNIVRTITLTSIDHSLVHVCSFGTPVSGRDGVNEGTVDEIVANIDAMTTTTYRQEIKKKLLEYSAQDTEEHCVICLESFQSRTLTPCFHSFCRECISNSLGFKRECPTCRAPCTKKDLIRLVEERQEKYDDHVLLTNSCGKKYIVLNDLKEIYDVNMVCEKFVWLRDNIQKFQERGESTVVFSAYTPVLKRLHTFLEHCGVKSSIMTKSSTRTQMKSAVHEFGMTTDVFLLSTQMASVGINLSTASNVVFMEPLLNEDTKKQSIGRIRRIGQNKNIYVYTLQFDNGVEPYFSCLKIEQDKYINDVLRKRFLGKRFKMERKKIRNKTIKKVLETATLWAQNFNVV